MCHAFSGVIKENGEVLWQMGMDSHEDIIEKLELKDTDGDRRTVKFARFEIAPANGDYLNPGQWLFKVDEKVRPAWFNEGYEQFCWTAQKEWKKKLDKILVHKPIVHPFRVAPPKKIIKKHIDLLKEWASVRDSVGASVWDSVWDSVRDSVGDSVWAYTGTFFHLPRKSWLYTDNIKTKGYPLQPAVDLWEMGLVPSFDGKKWRLHGGPDAKILWEGKIK